MEKNTGDVQIENSATHHGQSSSTIIDESTDMNGINKISSFVTTTQIR